MNRLNVELLTRKNPETYLGYFKNYAVTPELCETELGKFLAKNIITCDRRDDLSLVTIFADKPMPIYTGAHVSEEKARKMLGTLNDGNAITQYQRWDMKKDHESPEDYFDRHARQILSTFDVGICKEKKLRIVKIAAHNGSVFFNN